DGRWFLAWHSGDTSDWQTPFDTDLPPTATKQLPGAVVNEVKKQLQSADFSTQSPYQVDQTVEDGSFYIVTARIDGKVHEVIYEGVYPALVEFLDTIVSTYQYNLGNDMSKTPWNSIAEGVVPLAEGRLTFPEALVSPCASCQTAPCCTHLPLH